MIELTSDELRVLSYLKLHGATFCVDFSDEDYVWCRALKRKGLVVIALPDPNFLYQLSPERRSQYQVKLTGLGLEQLTLHLEKLQKEAEAKAEQEAKEQRAEAATQERWRKDARRSWNQFWLNALFGVIGFAAGVFVEHYFTVLDLFFAVFGWR